MLSVAIAGCSGGSTTPPASSARSSQTLQHSAGPASTTAPGSAPLVVGNGSGLTPVFSTKYDASLQTNVMNGYAFQSDSASSFVNVFDSNRVFLTQFEAATTGSNGLPTLRFVGNDGTFFACSMIDTSAIPSNADISIGDATIHIDDASGITTASMRGQTVTSRYDAASGTFIVTAAGMTFAMPGPSAPAARGRSTASLDRSTKDFVDTDACRKAWNTALALAILIAAAIVSLIACAAATSGWGGWFCKIAFDKVMGGLAALLAATMAFLLKECYNGPQPSPSPTQTPAATPTPVSGATSTPMPVESETAVPLPIHSNLPYNQ